MLRKGDYAMIEEMRRRGMYKKDIAEELGVHARTVSRALARGGSPCGRRSGARSSKLDPYKGLVDRLISEGVWNGRVILEILRERGYDGCYTILSDYIRPKRVLREARRTVRFETAPGVQMQNDWGEEEAMVGGRRRKVCFSVNTLGYSRRFHFWCCERKDSEHTYEGIILAFEHFGGVAQELLIDNQRTMVIEHRVGERVKYHQAFLDLASYYGFRPRACRPYRARTKGKDERMVQYIKRNFFQRYRSFESLDHMNNLAEKWLAEVADLRVHGTVKEVVAERFEREAPYLGPLPPVRFEVSYRLERWVSWDGFIDVRGNRYSVPDEYRGRNVVVRVTLDGIITVYAGERKIATHLQKPAGSGWVEVEEHHKKLWEETLKVERRELSVYEEVIM